MRAGGQDGSDMAGSVGLQRRTSSPAAGPGLKSGEGKARAGETRARQVSWALDGASARFWGVVVQRGGAGTAAQGLCMAGLCGRAARVWRRRLRGGDGLQGSSRFGLKGPGWGLWRGAVGRGSRRSRRSSRARPLRAGGIGRGERALTCGASMSVEGRARAAGAACWAECGEQGAKRATA